MICYAVIDTNVLVSALLSGNDDAATVQVVRRLLCGEIVPVFSKEIVREYREVLCRAKFGFSPGVVERLISSVERDGILLDPTASDVTLPDMKDLPFYEVVLEKRKETDAAYLVTGNIKHFPVRPFIVTPRELLDILAGSN